MTGHHLGADWSAVKRKVRPILAAQVRAGTARCVDCRQPIRPDERWAVGHIVSVSQAEQMGWSKAEINAVTNLGATHHGAKGGKTCNQRSGGRMGSNARNRGTTKASAPTRTATKASAPERAATVGGSDSSETARSSPALGSEDFFPTGPQPEEHSGVPPLNRSSFEGYERGREEFLIGARLLGLDTDRKPIQPQQYVVGDALNAQKPNGVPLHAVTAISIPRRATKTTSWWAVALGRISNPDRGDYQVGFTAQTQVKARERWLKDLVKPLERQYPDPKESPYIINRQPGASFIECRATGGRISILPPSAESFRGEGFALVGIDEAQEVDAGDESEDLVSGILPTFDTITIEGESAGQLVLLGTAGEHQGGVFWDYLQLGREGKSGIVEYAAHPDTPVWEEGLPIEGTTADPEVWKAAHPGAGGLTPMSVIRERFEKMTSRAFCREYLGLWPEGIGSAFINPIKWEAGALTVPMQLPDYYVAGFYVSITGLSAALVAAWRVDGVAHLAVIKHAEGTSWLKPAVLADHKAHGQAFVYDAKNAATDVEGQAIKRARVPRLKLVPQNWIHVSTAASLFMKELNSGNLRHYDQQALNLAVRDAVKGQQPQSSRWSFRMSKPDEQDITALEAGALALRAYDELKPKAAPKPRSVREREAREAAAKAVAA
ncbi:hypothetical protein [Marisediminicola sp. LYQ85]|uniref:hypothetical protein n=1 Tax=Marisediminicola sp. LYQ85 TaxID=3391062 RepID=UPI003982DBF8